MTEADRHWTEDQEMLEAFVLGRCAPEEHERLSRHLLGCATCRATVKREEELVHQLRAAGRHLFKTRLKHRVEPDRRVPWPRILSAAALIAIVVGVGVLFDWRKEELDQTISTPIIGEEDDNKPGTTTSTGGVKADRLAEQKRDQPADERLIEDAIGGRDGAATGATERENRVSVGKTLGEKGDDVASKPRSTMKAEVAAAQAPEYDTGGADGIWIEGVYLTEPATNEGISVSEVGKLQDKDFAAERSRQEPTPRQDEKLKKKAEQVYRVEQQAYNTLPPPRQQIAGARVSPNVNTLVQQSADGPVFVLFPERTLDQKSLKEATVEEIGPDSVIIQVGNQKISYRLPSGWQSQLETKKK